MLDRWWASDDQSKREMASKVQNEESWHDELLYEVWKIKTITWNYWRIVRKWKCKSLDTWTEFQKVINRLGNQHFIEALMFHVDTRYIYICVCVCVVSWLSCFIHRVSTEHPLRCLQDMIYFFGLRYYVIHGSVDVVWHFYW